MKKAARSVRIGLGRRGSVSPEINSYELTSNIPERSDQEVTLQVIDGPISKSKFTKHELENNKYTYPMSTPKNIRLQTVNELANNEQLFASNSNSSSPPTSRLISELSDKIKLHTIGSKSK